MIPLLLLALGLGAVALTYEVSPKARARVDVYVNALRAAHAAHQTAAVHLTAAQTAPDPAIAAQLARAAAAANRVAAQKTIAAAQLAQTPPERAAALQSATTVVVREDEITDTVTDAHLGAASMTEDPAIAVEHVQAATEANRAAAQKAAEAAQAAQTERERAAAAQSAAKVLDRDNKIAAALAKLGAGQCGVRSYAGVTPQIKDVLFARLQSEGMTVTGDNPWDIETHKYEVKLRALWDPKAQALKLIVTSGEGGLFGLVTCAEIWKKIEPILKEVVGV